MKTVLRSLESWQIEDIKKLVQRAGMPRVEFTSEDIDGKGTLRFAMHVVYADDYDIVAGQVRAYLHGFACGMREMTSAVGRAEASATWRSARVVEPADSYSRISVAKRTGSCGG